EVSKAPSELEAHEVVAVPENEQGAEAALEDVTDADGAEYDGTTIVALRPLLTKVKRIVRFFRNDYDASQMLVQMQIQEGKMEHETLKLTQEVKARWNSCYYMLERFLELSDPVNRILSKLQKEGDTSRERPPDLIYDDQLEVLGEVKDLLKPLGGSHAHGFEASLRDTQRCHPCGVRIKAGYPELPAQAPSRFHSAAKATLRSQRKI
ncbi:hypothetical protein MTO96_036252, partial [Rhipicephalus appendiculatus]